MSGPASAAMGRLGRLMALSVQPLARRPRLISALLRTGLPARDFPLTRRMRRGLAVSCRMLHGRPIWRLAPQGCPADAPLVLYLHGGAHACGMSPLHWRLVARLAHGGAVVVAPMNGLVPRWGALEALALLKSLWDDLVRDEPGRAVTIMGDSAGGNLALVLSQSLCSTPGVPGPAGLVLIAPWVDLSGTACPMDERREGDPMLARAGALALGRMWARGLDMRDPRVSPLLGPMKGLPPVDIYQGTRDMLRPQVEALAERMRAAGVEVDLTLCPGAIHDYPLFDVPEGRAAALRIEARLQRGQGGG